MNPYESPAIVDDFDCGDLLEFIVGKLIGLSYLLLPMIATLIASIPPTYVWNFFHISGLEWTLHQFLSMN